MLLFLLEAAAALALVEYVWCELPALGAGSTHDARRAARHRDTLTRARRLIDDEDDDYYRPIKIATLATTSFHLLVPLLKVFAFFLFS